MEGDEIESSYQKCNVALSWGKPYVIVFHIYLQTWQNCYCTCNTLQMRTLCMEELSWVHLKLSLLGSLQFFCHVVRALRVTWSLFRQRPSFAFCVLFWVFLVFFSFFFFLGSELAILSCLEANSTGTHLCTEWGSSTPVHVVPTCQWSLTKEGGPQVIQAHPDTLPCLPCHLLPQGMWSPSVSSRPWPIRPPVVREISRVGIDMGGRLTPPFPLSFKPCI